MRQSCQRDSCSNFQSECTCAFDYGAEPHVADIKQEAEKNKNFRTAYWTGEYLQMTLMCIPPCGEIGWEVHMDTDQFIHVEEGQGMVEMGHCKGQVNCRKKFFRGCAVFVPAGTWHNILNTGRCALKLSSIYAPPHHPHGTVHQTKKDADRAVY